MLLPASMDVTLQADDGPEELLVTIDGQVGTNLHSGETLSVRRAKNDVLIVRFPGTGFFTTLRGKLAWGGLADRDKTQ
jgi:NAD+ kinase